MTLVSRVAGFFWGPAAKDDSQSSAPASSRVAQSNPGNLSLRGLASLQLVENSGRVLEALRNPYDRETNPNGIINLGVAENYLMIDDLTQYVNKNLKIEKKACTYGTGSIGSPRLRKAMASFWNDEFHPHEPVLAEHVLFANGITAICEMLGCNLADPGDSVLMSSPIYGAFDIDFTVKADLDIVHVSTGSLDPTGLDSVPCYEKEIKKLLVAGKKPRFIVLCHPHNPLGSIYSRETLIAFCNLCAKYDLHLVSDEVYAMSVFRESTTSFASVHTLELSSHSLPLDRIHILYGFSKDFAGGGLRLGCLITRNKQLFTSLGALAPMASSSSLVDMIAATILEDRSWTKAFFAKSNRRLLENYNVATAMLDKAGIQYYHGSVAGFFLWVDFSPFLPPSSRATTRQDHGKSGQDILLDRFFEQRVWLNSAKDFHGEHPGWFRIIFAQEKEALVEGFKRLIQVARGEDFATEALAMAS